MDIEALTDQDWMSRCVERLVSLDPQLEPSLARPIVVDLCGRQRWRSMLPERAAETLFDYQKSA